MSKCRVKTPTVIQMEATECGAAALSIIMSYYGCYIPLEQLRIDCGVSRDGSKAANILAAAKKYGMQADGLSCDMEGLKSINLPCIVFWNFNHFLIVEGFKKNKVYLNDPATGPRVIYLDEFKKSFTGVVLEVTPTETFVKQGQPKSIWKSISDRLNTSSSSFAFLIIASLALVIPGIVIPGFSKIFIDNIIIENMHKWFVPLILGMILTAILRAIFSWLQQMGFLRMQMKFMLTATSKFLWHMLHLPIMFYDQRYSGDISARIEANERIATLLSTDLTTNVVGIFTMIFYASVMLLLDWKVSLISICIVLINFSLLYFIGKKIEDTNRYFLQEKGKLAGVEMCGIRAVESLKASASESDFFRLWTGSHAQLINVQQKIAIYNQMLLIFPKLLNGINIVFVLGFGSWQIINGQLTVGSLVAIQTLLVSLNQPLNVILAMAEKIQAIRGDITRLDDVLENKQDTRYIYSKENSSSSESDKLQVNNKEILALNNVRFGYSETNAAVLEDINIKLSSGSKVAIVGESGSGKTTLIKLLCGLYQPWNGDISFLGKNLNHVSYAQIAENISLVSQDVFFFAGTVKDNLTLWDDTISDDKIIWALKAADIYKDIFTRNGLATLVLENGTNFSGGQCQRLAIARALVANPKLLILDEATSAMDPILEKSIYDNLFKFECGLIIIAHRLSTIRDSDEIIVIQNGHIVERGKHDDLIKQQGAYSELINLEE